MGRRGRVRRDRSAAARPPNAPGRAEGARDNRGRWLALALACACVLVYAPALRHGFLNFDDNLFIFENPQVQKGLTSGGIRWAFTSLEHANWQPLTWITHMALVQVFGMNAWAFHAASLVFHAAAAVLLFRLLSRTTGRLLASAFGAALFALHPLRVESVAWAAELKDPLAGVFFLATLLAFVDYVRRPGAARYALTLAWMACGLLVKPSVVTAPFVLLLLDVWPLGRLRILQDAAGKGTSGAARDIWRLIAEKAPLFLLSFATVPVVLFTQTLAGAVGQVPLVYRLGNTVLAYGRYLGKNLVPTELAAVYPHPGTAISPPLVAGAALLLVLLSGGAWVLRRAVPAVSVGWCWFLGALVPSPGLIQAGVQAMADRYTYLPSMGLAIAVAWGLSALARRIRLPAPATAGLAVGLALVLASASAAQVRLWESNLTLFGHTLAVTERNWLATYLYGLGLSDAGRVEEAVEQYQKALSLNPASDDARYSLGNAYLKTGRVREAEESFRRALESARSVAVAARFHNNLGIALARQGRFAEAARHFRTALEAQPQNVQFQKNLARALADAERGLR